MNRRGKNRSELFEVTYEGRKFATPTVRRTDEKCYRSIMPAFERSMKDKDPWNDAFVTHVASSHSRKRLDSGVFSFEQIASSPSVRCEKSCALKCLQGGETRNVLPYEHRGYFDTANHQMPVDLVNIEEVFVTSLCIMQEVSKGRMKGEYRLIDVARVDQ